MGDVKALKSLADKYASISDKVGRFLDGLHKLSEETDIYVGQPGSDGAPGTLPTLYMHERNINGDLLVVARYLEFLQKGQVPSSDETVLADEPIYFCNVFVED